MDSNTSFLGQGWSFPPRFDLIQGQAVMANDETNIKQSIQHIVSTVPGERIMHPKFGCHLANYLFEEMDSTRVSQMRKTVEDALLLYEPRINVENVDIDISGSMEGKFQIYVEYKIIATNTRTNIVFPYYKKEGTDL